MSKIATIISKPLAICLLLVIGVQNTQAANDGAFFGKEAKGKWLIGVKAASIDSNIESISDADAVGIVVGYEFFRTIGDGGGSSTVEFEYVRGDETGFAGFASYEVDIANLFFTYRTAGKLYFKAKAGASYADLTFRTPGFDADFEDVSLAGGLGLGYHVGDYGVVEVEYSGNTGDNDFGIIGVNALLEF